MKSLVWFSAKDDLIRSLLTVSLPPVVVVSEVLTSVLDIVSVPSVAWIWDAFSVLDVSFLSYSFVSKLCALVTSNANEQSL